MTARLESETRPTPDTQSQQDPALHARMQGLLAHLNTVILGKPHELRLTLTCLLAGGHLLIEDRPGVGKTTLAYALGMSAGLQVSRVQFTSDLMPADLLGVSIYDRQSGAFIFHQGPVFTQLLLADELNRATPRTQSALLEAMEERQVSIDGQTRSLPDPFFVIATQNPAHHHGTFPLPEAQLDRFLLRVSLGYPDASAERTLLQSGGRRAAAAGLPARLESGDLHAAQREVRAINASDALITGLQRLLHATRADGGYDSGLSPRAALGLLASARAWAWLAGRRSVWPDDLKAVFPAVAGHRLLMDGQPLRPENLQSLLDNTDLS